MYITRGKKDMSANSRNRTEYEISKARRRFAIIFLAAVVATAGMISFIITKQAVDNMRSKIVNLISSNNQQLGYNVDNYLVGIEDTVALFSPMISCVSMMPQMIVWMNLPEYSRKRRFRIG